VAALAERKIDGLDPEWVLGIIPYAGIDCDNLWLIDRAYHGGDVDPCRIQDVRILKIALAIAQEQRRTGRNSVDDREENRALKPRRYDW
jgi:hypothetical protein